MFLDPWSSLCPRMRVQDIVAELLLVVNRLVSKQEKAGLSPLHHLLGDVLLAAHGIYRCIYRYQASFQFQRLEQFR